MSNAIRSAKRRNGTWVRDRSRSKPSKVSPKGRSMDRMREIIEERRERSARQYERAVPEGYESK